MLVNSCFGASFFGVVVLVSPPAPFVLWMAVRAWYATVGGASVVGLFTACSGFSSAPQEERKTAAVRQRTARTFGRDSAVSPFLISG